MLRFALAAVVLAIFTPACAEEAPRDASNDDAPRLASLSPALAQMVRDLGHGASLVGRDGYDAWSAQALPVVGDLTGIDYESLLAVDPTHLLMEPSASGVPTRLASMAERQGWEIVLLATLSIEDVETSAAQLAEFLDAQEALDEWRESWSEASEPLADAKGERPLVLLSTDPPAALGPGSVHHEMLALLGCDPVPAEGSAYQQLALEDVIALNPTSIVLLASNETSEDIDDLLGPLTRLDLDAVRARRVVVVRDAMALIPSTSLVSTMNELSDGIDAMVSEP